METQIKAGNGAGKAVQAEQLLKAAAPAAPAAPAKPSTKRLWGAGAAALAVALGAGYWLANKGWASTDDAFIEGHVVPVSPKVSGHVLKVLVRDNEEVKKDQVLAELDARDYETQRDDARAAVEGAQAAARRTQLDAARYQALLERREASRQTVDHALADAQSARAALEAAGARLRQAELNLSYTRITAPQDGRVTRKTVEEGAYVAVVPKEVWVVANFKETQLRDMRPGQAAEVSVDAYPGTLRGRVESLQSGTGARFSILPAENATGNFVKVVQRMPVKIVLEEPLAAGRLLAPGMSVEARVRVE